jgi:hypothetical protein
MDAAVSESLSTDALIDGLRRRLGDRYEIVRELGRGGMGTVLLARDRSLDRPVALKVLPPEFAAQTDLRERFLRETRLAAGFSHPNIVPVFAVEDRDDLLAFAMGFVEGESLAQRVRRSGPLTAREAVRLLQDVGYALSYAHGRGVVHRDIKPDNVMIERATGRAMVMDFGIARAITPAATTAGLTRVGEVVGTPEYMSPEQASGDVVDGRSDLYSLGLVAWFAVTGHTAVTGESTQRILVKQLTEAVSPVASHRPDLPAELAAVIDRCIQKEPGERFPSAEALVDALDAARLGAPEIPLAVRLFQIQWQRWIGNTLLFAGLALWVYFRVGHRDADLDRHVVVWTAVAVLFVLFMTLRRQAASMGRRGFTHAAMVASFRALLSEGDEARAQALSLPDVRRGRRVRLLMAPFVMLVGVVNVARALATRTEVAPGVMGMSRVSSVVLISGAICVVIGAVLLGTDPYRRPVLQQVGNWIFAGAFGRWMLGPARGAPGSLTPVAITRAAVPAATAKAADPADAGTAARLSRLEVRVATLERERNPS